MKRFTPEIKTIYLILMNLCSAEDQSSAHVATAIDIDAGLAKSIHPQFF